MANELTDDEIDALVESGGLSAATAAKMKSGEQKKPTGGNYAAAGASMGAKMAKSATMGLVDAGSGELAGPTTAFSSPFQKAMAAAANKAAEDAVAKYHAATRQPTAAPALAPGQIAPNTIAPGATFGPSTETRGSGAAPEAASPELDATMARALPKSSAMAPAGGGGPKVASQLIDPALLDALHAEGKISPETAAQLHEMNGTESKVTPAEKPAEKEDEKLLAEKEPAK